MTAVNVFTGQPAAAVADDYTKSERELLQKLLAKFKANDLSLLDRGLGGGAIYLAYQEALQFFIHRAKTTGDRVALYVQDFLLAKKKQQIKKVVILDKDSGKLVEMELRLILAQ